MAHMNIINNFISTSCRLYSVVDCQLDCMCASCKSWSSRLECVCLCVCKCVCTGGCLTLDCAPHSWITETHLLQFRPCPVIETMSRHPAVSVPPGISLNSNRAPVTAFFLKKKKLDQRSRSRCPPLRVRLHYNTVCVCVCMIHEVVKHQTYVNFQLHSTVCGQSTQGWLVKMSPLQVYSLMWRIWNV